MRTENISRFFNFMQFQHLFKQTDTEKAVFYAWLSAMHTRIDVALCNFSEENSMVLLEKICKEIKRIEQMADRFDAQSEISKMNRLAAIEPFTVSTELYTILEDCVQYNRTTFGAFDITVQSLNDYRQGINDIVLDPDAKTVFFKNINVQVDLCGFIKGYALDRVRAMLTDSNCINALANFGNSSVCALGNHPNGKGWKINLPNQGKDSINLFNQCLTNSGNSADHFHIIHPETGKFGESTEIVSIITENAIDGEVLSTALCVCEPELKDIICKKLKGKLPMVGS